MTKARDLANIISGGFTADDIPNLDAAKITSGSFADARIPNLAASKITSGTFADARIAASNVSQHATSFDDNKIVNDISTLALRQSSNENRAAYNTNSMYVDVFQDSTGITNLTNTQRTTDEYIDSKVLGTLTELDYFNPTQSGGGTSDYTFTTNNKAGGDVSNQAINSGSKPRIDFDYAQTNGGYPIYTNNLGSNTYIQYDYQEIKRFSSQFKIAKSPTHGDLNQAKLQYSTDGTNWSNFDLSGCSVSGSNPSYSSGSYSGGALSNFASDGTFNFSAFSGVGTVVINMGALVTGLPAFNARYIRYYAISKHSYNDTGWGIFTPYVQPLTTNATGSFESNAITAPSSVSSMGAIITYQDQSGTNTLNTDIVLKLSADGGSNFATATMTAMPDFATGIKMAKVNDLSVTAGTSLKYKIEFANQASGSKEARIRGISLQY